MFTQPHISGQIDIVNGPDRDRLIDAFKYAHDRQLSTHIAPWFDIVLDMSSMSPYTTSTPKKTRVIMRQVKSLAHESSDGQSFLITAAILNGDYEVYYDAKQRRGRILRKVA